MIFITQNKIFIVKFFGNLGPLWQGNDEDDFKKALELSMDPSQQVNHEHRDHMEYHLKVEQPKPPRVYDIMHHINSDPQPINEKTVAYIYWRLVIIEPLRAMFKIVFRHKHMKIATNCNIAKKKSNLKVIKI